MEAFNSYTYGTAVWLAVQATPLLLSPKLMVSMLASDVRPMTQLESYLCRALALALLMLALLNLVVTNTLPLTPASASGTASNDLTAHAYPVLIILTVYHALTTCYIYTQYTQNSSIAFLFGMIGSGALFCLGTWVVLFGSEKGRVSKTTGADKRTGNWPFKNEESAKEKKRAVRKRM